MIKAHPVSIQSFLLAKILPVGKESTKYQALVEVFNENKPPNIELGERHLLG